MCSSNASFVFLKCFICLKIGGKAYGALKNSQEQTLDDINKVREVVV